MIKGQGCDLDKIVRVPGSPKNQPVILIDENMFG